MYIDLYYLEYVEFDKPLNIASKGHFIKNGR